MSIVLFNYCKSRKAFQLLVIILTSLDLLYRHAVAPLLDGVGGPKLY